MRGNLPGPGLETANMLKAQSTHHLFGCWDSGPTSAINAATSTWCTLQGRKYIRSPCKTTGMQHAAWSPRAVLRGFRSQ